MQSSVISNCNFPLPDENLKLNLEKLEWLRQQVLEK